MSWHFLLEIGEDLEHFTCSQAEAEAYWPTEFWDILPSARSKSTDTIEVNYYAGSVTEHSHAKILAQPVKEPESQENAAVYGPRWFASFARFAPRDASWKTRQLLWDGGLESFSETWPKWGIMHDGECSELETQALHIYEIESGYSLATPTKCDHSKVSGNPEFWKKRLREGRTGMDNLPEQATTIYPDGGGRIHPHLHEWMMGWPIGMTELKPLATDKFQSWLLSHIEYLNHYFNQNP